MRTTILQLLQALPALPQPIWEFGSYHVVGQEHRGSVKGVLGDSVVGCDLREGPGVDRIEDLHRLTLANDSIGTALLLDTVEHVARPWQALEEIHRVLRPGGIVLMTSHMYFPIHAHPDDFWRFTKSGFSVLLAPFEPICVESAGMTKLPHTIIGVAAKAPVDPALKAPLAEIVSSWARGGANSWKERILALLPPVVLVPAYDGFMRMLQRRRS
jgi:SAM-dependent methyltransferase